jgi:hypothetical protein
MIAKSKKSLVFVAFCLDTWLRTIGVARLAPVSLFETTGCDMKTMSKTKGLSAGVLALAALVAGSAVQAQTAKKAAWKAPRTEYGVPDLQGNWTNVTLTPLERPAKFGNRLVLTPEEEGEISGTAAKHVAEADKPTDPNARIQDLPKDCGYGFSGANCGYNNFWVDRGDQAMSINGEPRSSFLVDPPNGRLPAMTEAGRQRQAARMAARRAQGGAVDGPEARGLGERCLMSFGNSAGPPMLPQMYNSNYTIVQSKDTIIIMAEMVHDVRVIRMNGKPLPNNIKRWMGDSIGRWEGDTLVVETTNVNPMQSFRGASPDAKYTERFTRIAPNQILYKFTVDDPSTFVQPFSGELAFNAQQEQVYEYACHEGNYALPGILAGAREDEKAAAAGKAVQKRDMSKDEDGE